MFQVRVSPCSIPEVKKTRTKAEPKVEELYIPRKLEMKTQKAEVDSGEKSLSSVSLASSGNAEI